MFRAGFLLFIVAICARSVSGQNRATNAIATKPTVVFSSAKYFIETTTNTIVTTTNTPATPHAVSTELLPDTLVYSCKPSEDGTAFRDEIRIDRRLNRLLKLPNIYAYKMNNTWEECLTNNDTNIPAVLIIWNCWNVDVIVVPLDGTNIIGGHDSKMYRLKCVGPDKGGINLEYEIAKTIDYIGSESIHGLGPVYAYEFEMIISDHYGKPRDSFLIGDKMTMTIKLKGNSVLDLRWKVINCTAYSTPSEIQFIRNSSIPDNKIAGFLEALNTSKTGLESVRVQLYAFHALHNNEVTYICSIRICRGINCLSGNRRRRRSLDDYNDTPTTQQKILVYDRIQDMTESGGDRVVVSTTMFCVVTLLIWILK